MRCELTPKCALFAALTMLLANGKVGSGSPPICNYLVAGAGDDGWWIQSVLLIPEAIVLLIGCCFMTALLYTLIKVRPTTPIITSLRHSHETTAAVIVIVVVIHLMSMVSL